MIGLIGLDHTRGTAALRGRVSFAGDHLLDALHALSHRPSIAEVVIISTCNRTEVYAATDDWHSCADTIRVFLRETFLASSREDEAGAAPRIEPAPKAGEMSLRRAILGTLTGTDAQAAAHTQTESDVFDTTLYEYEGTEAMGHLFRVAAGLQSMVVGEAQILGQVKDALGSAESVHVVGEELRAAFTLAIKVGKRTRAETEIGRADVSVAGVAVRVARESLGTLSSRAALLIGAGRTSQLCARLLRAEGIDRLILANRTAETAGALAEEVGADVIALADIEKALPQVELIISATAAPHTVLDMPTVARSTHGRAAPLVILDLAVPPDVDEQIGLLPFVSLYTLDSLRTLDGTTPEAGDIQQAGQIERVAQIIDDGLHEYQRGRLLRIAVPGIAALRRHVDSSEQAELERTLGHLQHLSTEDRAAIERFGDRLVDKMFHHLVSRIRALAEYDEVPPELTMRVLRRLFADPESGHQ